MHPGGSPSNMASIYKRSYKAKDGTTKRSPTYCIQFTDEHGRLRRVKGFRDKTATEQKAAQLVLEVERRKAGLPVGPNPKTTKITEAITAYIADMARRNTATDHQKESNRILTTIAQACSWQTLSQIAPADFTAYQSTRAANGTATRTTNRHHETLRAFCNWCVRTGHLSNNPIERLRMAPQTDATKRHRRRPLTLTEFHRLLEVAPAHKPCYQIAALSGLRRSELHQLQRRDVDLQSPAWQLRPEITKSRKYKKLPMLPEAHKIMQAMCFNKNPTDRLFTVPTIQTLYRQMKRAGIPIKDDAGHVADFHSFRYLFCVQLAKVLPIQVVQKLMRHSTITLTANLYNALGLTDLYETALSLPTILALPQPGQKSQEAQNQDQKTTPHSTPPSN